MSMQQPSSLFRRLPLSMLVSLALASTSQAQSLVDMYEMAKGYDASYQSAKAQYEANVAKADQGKRGRMWWRACAHITPDGWLNSRVLLLLCFLLLHFIEASLNRTV